MPGNDPILLFKATPWQYCPILKIKVTIHDFEQKMHFGPKMRNCEYLHFYPKMSKLNPKMLLKMAKIT